MTGRNPRALLRAAIAAVRECADTMENQAAGLLQALTGLPIDDALRATALDLSAGLRDTAGRATFELALLQTELGEGKADAAAAVRTLSNIDASMMVAVASMTDVAERLERAAETDERIEPAFVLVIEAVGVMLQHLRQAKAATEALRAALPTDR